MRMAAIYARVSSEQQREAHTIASQTAALVELAQTLELEVPNAWIFEDDGYSGATLERPGLERVRDLAAEGQIQVVLVHAPDRLSRKYAYQVLLIEEFARHGVETRFLKGPQSITPEDQLLVQFQGMIAEYERAQILERSRRGKRHRARAGEISVLSGAPYGYRYLRKTAEAAAAYVVDESEARVVRQVYALYTVSGLSIGAVTRWLNEHGVPTRKTGARWERSTVWAMLRNPAYRGSACFGKTRGAPRQRVTRPLRARGGTASRDSAHHERPREEWIEIPVPALITDEVFARAQELLQENKVRARRRTIEPSLAQGLVSCHRCGYALSRTSTRSSARQIRYYRCIGADAWRHLAGPVCTAHPVRQDLLDQIVWTEVMRLLQDPALVKQELDRRLAAARAANPTKQREEALQRDLVQVGKRIERVLTAYQEELVSLEQLRERMPPLRQRERALSAELQSIADQHRDQAAHLRLVEALSAFLTRLRTAADTLDIVERQRIVRLVVKEVLVGDDTIVIRHCIPLPSGTTPHDPSRLPTGSENPGNNRPYLLRSGSDHAALRRPLLRTAPLRPPVVVTLLDRSVEPQPNQVQHRPICHPPLDTLQQLVVRDRVEIGLHVRVVHLAIPMPKILLNFLQGLVSTAPRTIAIRAVLKICLKDRLENQLGCRLHHSVSHRRNTKWPHAAVRFRNEYPSHRSGTVRLGPQLLLQRLHQSCRPSGGVHDLVDRYSIHPWCTVVCGDQVPGRPEHVSPVDPVIQRIKPELRLSLRLLIELLSQREDFLGQPLAIDGEDLSKRLWQCGLIVRSVAGLAQAVLHVSDSASCRQGPFAPRALPRFPATPTPSDFCLCNTNRLLIPDDASGYDPSRADLPGSSISLSVRAVPSHPGEPNDCLCLWLRHPCWLHHIRQAGRSHLSLSRPNRVRSRYSSHCAPRRAPAAWLPRTPACSATRLTGIYMVTSLRSQERPGLSWRTEFDERDESNIEDS